MKLIKRNFKTSNISAVTTTKCVKYYAKTLY